MTYILTTLLMAVYNLGVVTTLKDITTWSWQEVGAMLGVLTIIGGGFIRLIQRTDEKLKLRVDLLEQDMKDKYKDCKDHIIEVEKRVTDDRDKEGYNRDRAMEKIENRIEKLTDLIIKFIEKA